MKMRLVITAALAALSLASMAQAQVAQPQSGYDYTNHVFRPINVDPTGKIQVIGSAAGSNVYGSDASGAAQAHAPITIGGSTSPTGTTGTVYSWYVNSSGYGDVTGPYSSGSALSSVGGLMVGGSDGTNYRHFRTDTGGNLYINPVGGANFNVSGNVASGATDSGNPVKVGGVYNATTLPTVTSGQRVDAQMTSHGHLMMSIYDPTSTTAAAGYASILAPGDGLSSPTSLTVRNFGELFNGSTWDQTRSIQGASAGTTGTGVQAVAIAPTASQNQAIQTVSSTALESGHVLKAAAGNLYRIAVTTTTSGYLLVFNSTTVPADGAVTPQMCRQVGVGSSEVDHAVIPQRYATGISVAFSTTGCFTKTASASAMFEGDVE